MRYLVMTMFIIVAIIHLLPFTGVLGAQQLAALYGMTFDDSNLLILLRHRAVLFGLLGCFFLYAAFVPAVQNMALIAGFISVVSFLWIAWSAGGYNPQLARVITADVIALVCLVIAAIGCIRMDQNQ
jgi:uncharacterized BrkB/YihY/UPF0761 family membrane protein